MESNENKLKQQAEDKPSARPISIVVCPRGEDTGRDLRGVGTNGGADQSDTEIVLKPGEVLYIQSATLGGDSFCGYKHGEFRLSVYRKALVYEEGAAGKGGEVIGFSEADEENGEEYYLSLKHLVIHDESERSPGDKDFTYPINICLDASHVSNHSSYPHPFVALKCEGHAEWNLSCWIGHPAAIPQLGVASGLAAPAPRTFKPV